MKNYILFFLIITGASSFSGFAQDNHNVPANAKLGNTLVMTDRVVGNEAAVISYHVEETIKMNFGSSTSTYTVPNLDLVNTNDLGPNNIRRVTPKYAKERVAIVNSKLSNAPVAKVGDTVVKPVKIKTIVSMKKPGYVSIDIVNTYERVLSKGYKSVDMLKKVGDRHYFDGDLVSAAEWYAQLFEMTTELDPVYYYRYAQSLKAINQIEKAKEMMALFEAKSH